MEVNNLAATVTDLGMGNFHRSKFPHTNRLTHKPPMLLSSVSKRIESRWGFQDSLDLELIAYPQDLDATGRPVLLIDKCTTRGA